MGVLRSTHAICVYRIAEIQNLTVLSIGQSNIKWNPLDPQNKVSMPPFHSKLGLIKQYLKALDEESESFQ